MEKPKYISRKLRIDTAERDPFILSMLTSLYILKFGERNFKALLKSHNIKTIKETKCQ